MTTEGGVAVRKERRDARANRRRLLDAARVAFATHGSAASVNEIARAAGVGVGTLYRKYPTKADLVLAIIDELGAELAAEIATRCASAGGDPVEELRGLVTAHLVVLRRSAPVDGLLRREAEEAANRAGPGRLSERFTAPLRQVLERGVALGTFRAGLDADLVGRAFFGMLDSRLLDPLIERDGVEQVADRCAAVLLHGVTA